MLQKTNFIFTKSVEICIKKSIELAILHISSFCNTGAWSYTKHLVLTNTKVSIITA